MDVTNWFGHHVGTVDDVDNHIITLQRSGAHGGQRRFLKLDAVDRVDNDRIYLKKGAALQICAA